MFFSFLYTIQKYKKCVRIGYVVGACDFNSLVKAMRVYKYEKASYTKLMFNFNL